MKKNLIRRFPFLRSINNIFQKENRESHEADKYLFWTLLGLLCFGFLMLSSAGFVTGYEKFDDPYYFFKHQVLYGGIIGLVGFLITYSLHYRLWRKYALMALLVSMGLLVVVFIPGLSLELNGSRSWISLWGLSFQPTELVKLTFLIYVATWLEGRRIKDLHDIHTGLKPFLIMMLMLATLILAQPDVGTLLVLVITFIILFYIAGGKIIHIAAMMGSGALGIMILMLTAPYRMARWKAFLDENIDPQGVGYHLNQALIAIGTGGFFGLGLAQSRQKFNYLPEIVGDSIFAVISEELGFFMASLLVAAFLFVGYRGYMIASKAPDMYGKLVAAGISTWILIQAFVNIAGVSGLAPFTGVTLPFISYGSSSILSLMLASGLLLNISKHTR